MKTTIDLPEELLQQARMVAARRGTTLRQLVQAGLAWVLKSDPEPAGREAALSRLRTGMRLGGRPLGRERAHERRPVS